MKIQFINMMVSYVFTQEIAVLPNLILQNNLMQPFQTQSRTNKKVFEQDKDILDQLKELKSDVNIQYEENNILNEQFKTQRKTIKDLQTNLQDAKSQNIKQNQKFEQYKQKVISDQEKIQFQYEQKFEKYEQKLKIEQEKSQQYKFETEQKFKEYEQKFKIIDAERKEREKTEETEETKDGEKRKKYNLSEDTILIKDKFYYKSDKIDFLNDRKSVIKRNDHGIFSSAQGQYVIKKDSSRKQNIFFFEVQLSFPTNDDHDIMIGIGKKYNDYDKDNSGTYDDYSLFCYNGKLFYNNTEKSYANSVQDKDIVGIKVDLDDGYIEFFINSQSQGKHSPINTEQQYYISATLGRNNQMATLI